MRLEVNAGPVSTVRMFSNLKLELIKQLILPIKTIRSSFGHQRSSKNVKE